MSTRCSIQLLVCFFLLVPPVQAQPKYVQVAGTHFVLNGKPYYFVGTNFWYGCYIGSSGLTGNKERLIWELDRLKTAGITNLRILGCSELSAIKNSLKPAIQQSPQVYDDSLLAGLDFVLSEMSKRDMHAVIFLNNFWEWSGGMAQYHSWFGGGRVKDPSIDPYYDFLNFSAAFYRNNQANESFRKLINDLVNRKNTFTGLYYYEDPAIMAWELANEPRPGNDASYINFFYQWIDSTAKYIHSIDPNHLVTTGNEGIMGCLGSEDIFLKAHQSRYIDYATIHVWALNWGWYNPFNSGTYSNALSRARNYIQEHIALARTLNKPLTMEEFGLPRDLEAFAPGSLTSDRNNYFQALLKTIYDSASTGSPIAGSNFWGWGGEGRSPNADYTWRVGDPFTCDPPMEKQGLNSIFDVDSSTIEVLHNHSVLMAGLREANSVVSENKIHEFKLFQNFPNPFNPTTVIEYELPTSAYVQLTIHDILGRQVATLVSGELSVGKHSQHWSAANLPSGVYYCRLSAIPLAQQNLFPPDDHQGQDGLYTKTIKLLLMK